MADRSGPDLTSPDKIFLLNKDDRNNTKKKRMNELMQSLRTRSKTGASGRSRTWNEAAKLLRMSMTDKKHQIEASEKQKISMHLSVLQCAFKVNSQKSMLERIEQLCQDLNLNFTKGTAAAVTSVDHVTVFISSVDLFYFELLIDTQGIAIDVKLWHGGEPMRCMEIVKLLNESKFEEFREHLQGILAIYNITNDKKMKTKAFTALQSLETDLNNLSKLQCTITNVPNFIHKSPLGILIPRVGGTPMKLVYFVGPYDLLDQKTRTSKAMTIEGITENDLGHSVTVCLEPSSTAQKLQTMSLMTVNKTQDGKSLPCFAAVNSMNSTVLNAIFVLKLHKKMAMTCSVLHAIQKTTEIEFESELTVKSFVEVLVEQRLGEKAQNVNEADGLHVNLPDQNHRYFLGCHHSEDQRGVLVDRIPFLHPTSVPTVIKYLRQQALFNTVLGSCVRNATSQDPGQQLTFDVTPVNLQTISVSFEHPFTDAIATADLDLSDITALRCHISSIRLDGGKSNGETPVEICSDEMATRIFQRSLSLPVALRSVFHEAYDRMEQHITARPVSPPLLAIQTSNNKPLFCLQTLQNNTLPESTLSKKGKERRAAFLSAAANHRDKTKFGHLNSLFLTAGSGNANNPMLLPGVTQASMTATTSTATVSVPPPKYHQAVATATTTSHKAGPISSISTSSANDTTNSRDVTVISPEVISAYESGLIDQSHVTRETLEYIKKEKISKNPMLASLLDQERDSPENVVASAGGAASSSQTSMLSQLLVSDAGHTAGVTTATTNSNANNILPTDLPVATKPKHLHHPHATAGINSAGNQTQGHHQQQQLMVAQQVKALQKQLPPPQPQPPRKRKSTGDRNKMMNNTPPNSLNAAFTNNALPPPQMMMMGNNSLGRSPKRLLGEEDMNHHHHHHHHPPHNRPFSTSSSNNTTFSPISSAENDPSHHQQPPNPLIGIMNHPGVGGGGLPHPHHNHHPHHHHSAMDVLHHQHAGGGGSGPAMPPSAQQQPHQQLANFQSQTRVGGAENPPFSVVSSSVAMVTESNQSSSSSRPPSISPVLVKQASHNTGGGGGASVASSASNKGGSPGSSQSPIFCLSSSLDSLLKSEQKPPHLASLSSVSPPSANVLNSSSSGCREEKFSHTSSKYNELLTLLNDGSSESSCSGKSPRQSGRASVKTEGLKRESLTNNGEYGQSVYGGKVLTPPCNDIKKEDNMISLSMECESIDAGPAKERAAGFLEYKNVQSGFGLGKDHKRLRSAESDPFEFNDSAFDNNYSVDSTELSDVSLESESNSSLSKYTAVSSAKHNATSTHKEQVNSVDYYAERNHKREKKKVRLDGTKEYSVEENKKGMLGITMKINAKDGSAKTIMKQSPLHQSPPEYELIGSSKKWKESRSRYLTGDRVSEDSSMDGDVFVALGKDALSSASSEKSRHHSGSGNMLNSVNSVVASRILTSKRQGGALECSLTGGSNAEYVIKDKKKKSSKLSSESKQEKKRKRAAEAREKDQLIKKQKVYDFDLNESEHLPPTKIKIRTSDGKVQIQTDSMKTYSMSPLPMKPDCSSPSLGNSTSSSSTKRHKSEKSVKHKKDKSDKHSRSRSETQSGKADKNDSKLYNKRPVVKIKPLENTSSASSSTALSMFSVSIATAQGITKMAIPNCSTSTSPGAYGIKSPGLVVSSVGSTPTSALDAVLSVPAIPKSTSIVSEVTPKSIKEPTSSSKPTVQSSAIVKTVKEELPTVALRTGKDSPLSSGTGLALKNSKDSSLGNSMSSKASKETVPVISVTIKNAKEYAGGASLSLKTSKEARSSSPSLTKNSLIKTASPSLVTIIKGSKDDSLSVSPTTVKLKLGGSNNSNSSVSNAATPTEQVKSKLSSSSSMDNEGTKNGHSVTAQGGLTSSTPNSEITAVKTKPEPDRKRAVSVTGVATKGSPVLSSSSGNPSEKTRSLSEKTGSSGTNSGMDKQKVKLNNSIDKDGASTVKLKLDKVQVKENDVQSKVKVSVKDNEGKTVKDKPVSVKETDSSAKVKNKVSLSKEGESQIKNKSDKPNANELQKKQRKGSLTAVIDKLKKGFTEKERKPKKTQNMYDAIRHEILKAGDNKSSTLPIAKIGKKSKQELSNQVQTSKTVTAISNQSGGVTNQKPSSLSNPKPSSSSPGQNPKVNLNQKTSMTHKGANSVLDGILPKRVPSTSFRIPKTDSKSSISSNSSKTEVDHMTKGIGGVVASQSGSNAGTSTQSKSSGYSQVPAGASVNHVTAKNSSSQMNQINRQTSRELDKSKKLKVDDISEKLQSRHFLDAVDSIAKEESGETSEKKVVSSSQVQKGNKSANRTDSNHKDPRTWNSHYNNVNDGMARSKSPVVGNKICKPEKAPSSSGRSASPSLGGGTGSSAGGPVNSNKSGSNSSGGGGSGGNSRMNNQTYSSSQQKPPSKPKPTVVENKKHINNLLDQPKLIPMNKRDPRLGVASGKEGSNSPQPSGSSSENTSGGSSSSSSQAISYYNPAEALGRKTSLSSSVASSSHDAMKAQFSSTSAKDTGSRANSSSSTTTKAATVIISESPASPSEKPGLTIRHDTPPASPILNTDISDNKENLAKAIPLHEDKVVFKAPTQPKVTSKSPEDSVPARHPSSKAAPSTSHSGVYDKGKSSSENLKHLEPKLASKPTSSDPSSPEDCVITEVSSKVVHSNTPVSKAPVTIPLERSRSRSPNDRSRSPLTARSPSTTQRASFSSSAALSKTPKPDSPSCKMIKSGMEEILGTTAMRSPPTSGTKAVACNSLEEDDLMNDALML